jgi:spermidine synthase
VTKRSGIYDEVKARDTTSALGSSLTGRDVWLLRVAVVIGGASVMVVEILGSRVLAPSFGTTLHVWSALITVTLAALAVGYAFGGRVADRRPGLGALMTTMAVAAGMLLLADVITRPVLRLAYNAGMVGGTFLAATILFLPTLFLLGMVSPMAVRAAADQRFLGRSVGNLFALSTVGSVAGSLAVSLLMIPNMSVHAAIVVTAVGLTVPPLLYLLVGRRTAAAVILLVGVICAGLATKLLGDRTDRVVHYKNEAYAVTARVPSAYGELVVSDHHGVRFLFLNGVQQGSLIGNVSYARYSYGLQRLATARGLPKTMLIWGLGAGIYARAMAEAGTDVTVIEIDPMSEKVAREYFGLPRSVKVIIGDARTETLRLTGKYEVIVLDAFSGDAPPFHLLTREAFLEVQARLEPGGRVIANIVGGTRGSSARVIASVKATMESVFGRSSLFSPNWHLAGRSADLVTTMFLMTGEPPASPAPFTMETSDDMRRLRYVESVFASRLEVPREGAVVLTDAYAPLEAWMDASVKAMRF